MIIVDKAICEDHIASSSREWLETNGIGGYSSGTIAGTHTRRYHGLLIAAVNPPAERKLLLSKLEETLIVDGERFDLSTDRYPDSIDPTGFELITEFRLDPFPIWTYAAGGITLEKRVFMPHGQNTAVVSWAVRDRPQDDRRVLSLEVRPLVAFRDHHHLRHEDPAYESSYTAHDGIVEIPAPAGSPSLFLSHNAHSVNATGYWYRNFEYAIEEERGFDFTEDLFQPCSLTFGLDTKAVVLASTERRNASDAGKLKKAELKRRARLVAVAGADTGISRQLALTADQFVVERGSGKSVIAGYHWFSDWGRDTMISLPGLTLTTGRHDVARSILTEFADHISEGMLPNRFPDVGEKPDYNTVDATLWYFEAIRAYVEATGDHDLVRERLYEHLLDILDWHIRGTRYGIGLATDGLLKAGEKGSQLTWMDAKIGDRVVTPRIGKPVEIQALWYNALCVSADLADRFGDKQRKKQLLELSESAKESFNGQFWYADGEYLFDVVTDDGKDASVRPNQIFAVSLPHSMLEPTRARKVVDRVEAELLTPFGLRSLSPKDPSYVPCYIGSPHDRDAAYHQGTVWAWLIGPFVDAYRRTHSRDALARRRIRQMLSGLERQLSENMLGQIGEIFDGDAPHAARGCAAQAWSVAEVLRVSTNIK